MTCGADEYNDPYKIDIRLEDDRLKRYFERGLNDLLADEHFLVLYVPGHTEAKMQIVRPANDSYHRKRMIRMINEAKGIPSFYYALSHLWGLTKDNRYHWNDISEYVDDEEGRPVKPVSMRPEKRATLLSLLRAHPGSYWWIDVLCARTDTPLDIMGDIYACCIECVAMIDCKSNVIQEIHTLKKAGVLEEVEKLFRIVLNRAYPVFKLPSYRQLAQTKFSLLSKHLHTFFQSEWWQRVWTWQEMALPVGCVRFMAETDTHQHQTNTITVGDLVEFYKPFSRLPNFESSDDTFGAVCSSLNGILHARCSLKFRISRSHKHDAFHALMKSLGCSKRRCFDPADYVYGVLGMLELKIPRLEDPNAVWRHFLSKLDDRFPPVLNDKYIAHADRIDLRQVEAIGDVYNMLFRIYMGESYSYLLAPIPI